MAVKTLGSITVGSIVKLKEKGSLVDFYVAKHDYESELNGAGRTLVVRKDCYNIRAWHSSLVNAYASSSIDKWLNNTYKTLLDEDIQSVIGTTEFYYTPGNGNYSMTTLTRAVFLLSVTELGETTTWANTEGSALPIASTLQEAYRNGSKVDQWTRSPNTNLGGTNYNANSYYLNASGYVHNGRCTDTYGSRPAFTLPASLYVGDDGSVYINSAPTVTSSTANGANLGTKAEGFNFTYMVNDAESDAVTVKEYLDGVLKRSYEATLGQSNTFACVTAANFQKILNGDHTLEIVANDGKVDGEPYSVTFSKKVVKASVTLETPVTADDSIEIMVATIVGSLPDDAVVEVLVTNNANDSNPVWEDATESILKGYNHLFTNKTAANGFAFNFILNVERGPSDVGGHIYTIGGIYQ